jgi:hypothetical protein
MVIVRHYPHLKQQLLRPYSTGSQRYRCGWQNGVWSHKAVQLIHKNIEVTATSIVRHFRSKSTIIGTRSARRYDIDINLNIGLAYNHEK